MCLQPDTPNIGQVNHDFGGLIKGFAGGIPTELAAQQQFQPGFIDTALSGTNQSLFGSAGQPGLLSDFGGAVGSVAGTQAGANTYSRGANINDVGALGQAAAGAVGGVNPGETGLLNQLTQTASTQLAAGTQLLPSDVNRIQEQVRGNWASRGLGSSAPAQLDEALNLYGAGQQTLAARQGAAASAVNLDQQNITLPALGLATAQSNAPGQAQNLLSGAGATAQGAGPTLIPTSAAYDMQNTAYNAQAAANITGSNNLASLISGALSY